MDRDSPSAGIGLCQSLEGVAPATGSHHLVYDAPSWAASLLPALHHETFLQGCCRARKEHCRWINTQKKTNPKTQTEFFILKYKI